MKFMGQSMKQHACVHEAGHAVAACLNTLQDSQRYPLIRFAAVHPSGRKGITSFDWPVTKETIAAFGTVVCAGALAEVQRFGCCSAGYTSDRSRLLARLDSLGILGEERASLLNLMQANAETLLTDSKEAVAQVAGELMSRGRLEGDEILSIVQRENSMTELQFDGVDNYATIPLIQVPNSASWTLAIAFKSDAANSVILSQTTNLGGGGAEWLVHSAAGKLWTLLGEFSYTEMNAALALGISHGFAIGNFAVDLGVWYLAYLRRNAADSNRLHINLRNSSGNQNASKILTVPSTDGFHIIGQSMYEFPDAEFFGVPKPYCFEGEVGFMMHYDAYKSDGEMTTIFNGVKEILAERGVSL